MPVDVLVSYSWKDSALREKIMSLIAKAGYVGLCDVSHFAPGRHWEDEFLAGLAQVDPKPYLVIICTMAASQSENVLFELKAAREHGVLPIPIEVDEGAAGDLLRAAGFSRVEGRIHITVRNAAGDNASDEEMEDLLRRALTRRTRERLSDHRQQAFEWSRRQDHELSFWGEIWRSYFGDPGLDGTVPSVALLGRGGGGKTTLLAQYVRALLQDPLTYPILVDEDLLANAQDKLPDLIGARMAKTVGEQLIALADGRNGEDPMKVVFLVDGLDQMAVPNDFRQDKLVSGLRFLAEHGRVLVSCRPEIWGAWYTGIPGISVRVVDELGDVDVAALLRKYDVAVPADATMSLLKAPFFLDLALSRMAVWGKLPTTETAFLRKVWLEMTDDEEPDRENIINDHGRRWLVETIAALQAEDLRYEVPLETVERQPGYAQRYDDGLRKLRDGGFLIERPRREGGGKTVRLRHDLLDCYSMARVLLERDDRTEACKVLCMRSDKDCGWSVLTAIAQLTHDEPNPTNSQLMRDLFEQFLFVLDHKRFGDSFNAKAWAVTHVLQAGLPSLLGLILEALAGEPLASLDPKNPDHADRTASTLGPPARLTQEAASTLASAFLAGHLHPFADRIVPVLSSGLEKWTLRGRFLEALGLCGTPEAIGLVIAHGRRQMDIGDDLGLLSYVARGLAKSDEPEARRMVKELLAYPFEDRGMPTDDADNLRREIEEVSHDQETNSVQKRPLTEPEIIAGLRTYEPDGLRLTDWRRVRTYAIAVLKAVENGQHFSDTVVIALIGALSHEHTDARRAAAQALSAFTATQARDAILNQLLNAEGGADVREACLGALDLQFRRLESAIDRQTFRYLLLRSSQMVGALGNAWLATVLRERALDPSHLGPGDWLATDTALEVIPPSGASWRERSKIRRAAISQTVERELSALPVLDVGPDLEPKYRITGVQAREGALDIALSPTTWSEARRFHLALEQNPALFAWHGEDWILPAPFGNECLPGLAVVHAIVLTADRQVLVALRPAMAAYAPSHWSASFEEQVTSSDLGDLSSVFARAACRGLQEEFGIFADTSRVQLLSMAIEMAHLNLAVVVLVQARETLAEIRASWADEPRPKDSHEAVDIGGIDADAALLQAIVEGGPCDFAPLHPTSRFRLAVLSRWLTRSPTLLLPPSG